MQATRFRELSTPALLSLCLGAISVPPEIANGQSVRDAVKYGEEIVSLNREGKFFAWDAVSGKSMPDLSAMFSKEKFDRISSNGKRLWGVQGKKLLEWSPENKTW